MPNCPNVKLEDIWNVEQEILDVIHKVCVDNGLRYSLAYGTLLGAIRHKGFIPWDDDIDIMMPREDYNRLFEIWKKSAPEGFILFDDSTESDYNNNFAKVVKNNTAYIQSEKEKTKSFPKGLFVDIFPADRKAPGKLRGRLQYALFAINLLFNRGYTSGTGGLIGFLERCLLKIIRKSNYRKLSKWAGRCSRRWNNCKDSDYIIPCVISSCKREYPSKMFDELQTIMFNGKKYCAVRNADTVLRIEYGDYMQLPPEEERVWKHHPILIDLKHNYEELVKEGKA